MRPGDALKDVVGDSRRRLAISAKATCSESMWLVADSRRGRIVATGTPQDGAPRLHTLGELRQEASKRCMTLFETTKNGEAEIGQLQVCGGKLVRSSCVAHILDFIDKF